MRGWILFYVNINIHVNSLDIPVSSVGCTTIFWFKYDLGEKYYAPQVQPDRGSNS